MVCMCYLNYITAFLKDFGALNRGRDGILAIKYICRYLLSYQVWRDLGTLGALEFAEPRDIAHVPDGKGPAPRFDPP